MKLEDFDYNLPQNLIAQYPVDLRDHCRLLVFDKKTGQIFHHTFYEIIDFLNPGDVLVLNNSRVFPARLLGTKKETGGKVEILLQREIANGLWEVVGKNLKVGDVVNFENSSLIAKSMKKYDEICEVQFNFFGKKFFCEIENIGKMPLPPYIKRDCDVSDKENYQTVYAKNIGSAAAPTAGLHFTDLLLKKIKQKGIIIADTTLHVGLGTFAPVKIADIKKHKMHSEFFSVEKKELAKITDAKKENHRIIAVGTTTTRVLETIFSQNISPKEKDCADSTEIFIYPGYKFKCIDGIITNFHLPKSTLLMLVSAFVGQNEIKKIYREAIEKKYRFFSYGDAMMMI